MLAGAPPVGGFIARKSLAVAHGALPQARMGQGGRAQQRHKYQAEGEQTFTDRTHAKNLARAAAFPIRCTLVAMPILRARLLCNQAPSFPRIGECFHCR